MRIKFIPGLILLAASLMLPVAAQAQFTNVTGTVLDPNGFAYAGGTISASLVCTPNCSAGALINGAQFSRGPFNATLSSTGSFAAIRLEDNTQIVCLPVACTTQWQFTVNFSPGIAVPLGTGPQTFSVTLTISGTSQDISASLQAAAPSISGVQFLLANNPGIPAKNGNVFYPTNYGANFDALNVTGCSGTIALSSLTCTGASFIVTDQGKIVWESGTANATPDLPQTTISTVNTATNVTVAGTFARTSAAGEAVYGTDQTSKLSSSSTLWTAVTGLTNCGAVIFPAGGAIIQSTVLNTLPAHCAYDQFPVGIVLSGQSFFNTLFYPSPNFTYNSTASCGPSATDCFGPGQGIIRDMAFYGGYGGNLIAANTYNGAWINLRSPAYIQNVVMQSYLVPGNMQTVAVNAGTASITNGEFFGFAAAGGCSSGAAEVSVTGSNVVIGNSYLAAACTADGTNLNSTGVNLTVYGLIGTAPSQNSILIAGGNAQLMGVQSDLGLKASGASTVVNITGSTNSQNSAPLASLLTVTTGAKMYVANSSFTNSAAGANVAVTVDATSSFFDACGNVFTANNGVASITAGGKFYPCPTSTYNGTNTLISTFTPSGTGACSTISATKTGHVFAGTFICTAATAASTITLTLGNSPNGTGWNCDFKDLTTTANTITPTPGTLSTCPASAANINANDVIRFTASPL